MSDKILGQVVLPCVRLSYPKLFEKDEKYERFGATLLIPKDTKQGKKNIAALEQAIADVKMDIFGKKAPNFQGSRGALQDGDGTDQYGEPLGEEYHGNMFVNAYNKTAKRMKLYDEDKNPLEKEDDKLVGGDLVHAIIKIYGDDGKKDPERKGIYAALDVVQFYKFHPDGRFGSGGADIDDLDDLDFDDEYDDIAEDGEEDDLI